MSVCTPLREVRASHATSPGKCELSKSGHTRASGKPGAVQSIELPELPTQGRPRGVFEDLAPVIGGPQVDSKSIMISKTCGARGKPKEARCCG